MLTTSYLTPEFEIKSAMAAASAKVGTSRPTWLNVKARFLGKKRESWALDLSPTTMIGESWGAGVEPSVN